MRLLDYVTQSTAPFVVQQNSGEQWRLTGPSDYAQEISRCPLRYVLTDELVRACIDLAYSEGAGLSGCLDLVHFPAERVWIEWGAEPWRDELAQLLPECAGAEDVVSQRHGVLIFSNASGRVGNFRTFWLSPEEPAEPMMAAVETLVDLNGGLQGASSEALLDGGAVGVRDSRSEQIDALLRCASFRLTDTWLRYYAAVTPTNAQRMEVTRRSLATVVFDVPMLIALFLLMGLRSELVQVPISRERLNAKRMRLGRHPLLSHIEVSCPVLAAQRHGEVPDGAVATRTAARLHHVRGHIVRRADSVFWRRAHWRGHLRLGSVQSRTVTLRPPAALAQS